MKKFFVQDSSMELRELESLDFGYPIPEFRVSGIGRKIRRRQVEDGFSSFFAKCLPYLMIFQAKNLAKNEEKPCRTFLQSISLQISGTRSATSTQPISNF